jgi:hypothetical protein
MIGDHHILGIVEPLAGVTIQNRVGVAGADVNIIGDEAIPANRDLGSARGDRELGKFDRGAAGRLFLPTEVAFSSC